MKDWKKTLITSRATIRHTMQVINEASSQLALVVEPGGKLIGTVTDGDIRGALLKNFTLEDSIETLVNRNPITSLIGTPKQELIHLMTLKSIRQIPLINSEGVVQGLALLDEALKLPRRENTVILMAGGLGKRLKPLTNDCPKPLLKVRGKPILEWIIEGFIHCGFYRFCISVNYRADMISDYFKDGSKWGAEIEYLNEQQKLGTAGALGLLKETPVQPFFVMNGDLITQLNFADFLDFHLSNKNSASMAVQNYEMEVPYGVIEAEGSQIRKIVEKPTYRFLINSGIYLFSPEALRYLKKDEALDIPVLFERMVADQMRVECFPINGYWLDIGRREDLEQAHADIEEHITSFSRAQNFGNDKTLQ